MQRAVFHHLSFPIIPVLFSLGIILQGCSVSEEPGIPSEEVPEGEVEGQAEIHKNETFLSIPNGFIVELFAEDLPGARVIVQDGIGNFWVSQTKEGLVTMLEIGEDGLAKSAQAVLRNLRSPHGLAIDPTNGLDLFVAEEHRITRTRLYADASPEVIYELPAGGRHFTRTLRFGPDGRLYVSIGSTCDVCVERDERFAAILSMEKDGSDAKVIAGGLRNAVFFDWSYVDGRMWSTEMGRDHLGDNLPPDEVNIIEEGRHYGWPFCYGDRVRDERFQPETVFDCTATAPPAVELQAHVAPLGLAFVPEEGWPEEWWYDVLVAEHGSWNRSVLVGYAVVRIPLDAEGRQEGPPEKFLSGFHTSDGTVLGRPVDLLIRPGGVLYVTDDKAGVVYVLRRK